jgi:hypothetical protein
MIAPVEMAPEDASSGAAKDTVKSVVGTFVDVVDVDVESDGDVESTDKIDETIVGASETSGVDSAVVDSDVPDVLVELDVDVLVELDDDGSMFDGGGVVGLACIALTVAVVVGGVAFNGSVLFQTTMELIHMLQVARQ